MHLRYSILYVHNDGSVAPEFDGVPIAGLWVNASVLITALLLISANLIIT